MVPVYMTYMVYDVRKTTEIYFTQLLSIIITLAIIFRKINSGRNPQTN